VALGNADLTDGGGSEACLAENQIAPAGS